MHLTTFICFDDGQTLAILPDGVAFWATTLRFTWLCPLHGKVEYLYEHHARG